MSDAHNFARFNRLVAFPSKRGNIYGNRGSKNRIRIFLEAALARIDALRDAEPGKLGLIAAMPHILHGYDHAVRVVDLHRGLVFGDMGIAVLHLYPRWRIQILFPIPGEKRSFGARKSIQKFMELLIINDFSC